MKHHLDQVLPTDGTSLRKPDVSPILALIGRAFMRLIGFKLYGQVPDIPKFVLTAAPHTSNMDGFIMLATTWALRIHPDWMVKAELAKGPLAWLIRISGGIPIDRRRSHNAVDQVVELINEREQIMLVIAPEGTRKKTDYWRTGFYYIATKANVPIVYGFIDYKYKRAGVLGTFYPTGDINADMEVIWDAYRSITPRHPEKYSDMRLRGDEKQKDS